MTNHVMYIQLESMGEIINSPKGVKSGVPRERTLKEPMAVLLDHSMKILALPACDMMLCAVNTKSGLWSDLTFTIIYANGQQNEIRISSH